MGMIQIRNVPEDVHRIIKVQATEAGQSLSDYLLAEVRRMASRPTLAQMLDRLAKLTPLNPPESAAEALRAEREARDERW